MERHARRKRAANLIAAFLGVAGVAIPRLLANELYDCEEHTCTGNGQTWTCTYDWGSEPVNVTGWIVGQVCELDPVELDPG